MTDEAKRETLTLLGAGAAGLMGAGMAEAQNKTAARPEVLGSLKGGREPKPLPFDPAKLNGLSEKLIRSHWENNYVGSVKTLNLVSERLAAAMSDPELPPVLYGGLKREELHRVADARGEQTEPEQLWGSPSILVKTVTMVGTILSDDKHSHPGHEPPSSRPRTPTPRRVDRTGSDRRHP